MRNVRKKITAQNTLGWLTVAVTRHVKVVWGHTSTNFVGNLSYNSSESYNIW
jgi:hypothetical protein